MQIRKRFGNRDPRVVSTGTIYKKYSLKVVLLDDFKCTVHTLKVFELHISFLIKIQFYKYPKFFKFIIDFFNFLLSSLDHRS
jgi:hypothetical protein